GGAAAGRGRGCQARGPGGDHDPGAGPNGSAVPGLYAAGNAGAAVMGHSYADAGSTIGPAMTFGHIAALDLAGEL
ncbi:hypothetical protein ACFW91_29965, partial [Streptomyces asoensis]|uniref:hypothetical protein n=1 Tax=Streptomyces asoensis TaxID=249586 RepID=UPI0036B6D796